MKILISILALMLAGTVTACAADDEGSDDAPVIGYAGAVQANPNNKAIEDGIRRQVEALGGSLVVTDAQFDASKQLSDVRSLITRQVDVIIVWPVDPQGLQPAIQEADDAGIPVIVQDTADGGPYVTNFKGSDADAAADAAALIATTVGEGAGVGHIEGLPVVGVLAARNEGFVVGAKEHGLEIVVNQVNEQDSADGARPIVDAWKTSVGDELDAIFAYNDPSALGAASAVDGGFAPVVIGMNGSAEGVDGVRDGRLLATVDFHPVEQGIGLGWAAFEALEGRTLPDTILTTSTLITQDNVDEWTPIADALALDYDVAVVEQDGASVLQVTPRS